MTTNRPHYDPAFAAEQRARRAYAALQSVGIFGTALVLPNREAGFTWALVTHVKKTKRNEH